MPKKILIHSLIFSPDGVSTAYLYNDIALKFQENGYEVLVLTTTPHYNVVESQLAAQPLKWKVWGICKESCFHGIRVLHVPQKKFRNTFLRVLGFVYWHIISFLIGLSQRNVDVILSPSPPLTIGVINIWLAKIKGCKTIYNVQEIYPDILKRKDGLVIEQLRRMERYVYNNSTAVTTIDQVFYNVIAGRFKDKSKLCIIPNFVDTELYNSQGGNVECLNPLDRAALRSILTEPKNSIIKQYIKLFEMDNVKLTFEDAVFEYIVDKAVEYKLGARGLRSIVETIMMDAMFEIPSEQKDNFVVTLDYAKRQLEKANIARLQSA